VGKKGKEEPVGSIQKESGLTEGPEPGGGASQLETIGCSKKKKHGGEISQTGGRFKRGGNPICGVLGMKKIIWDIWNRT